MSDKTYAVATGHVPFDWNKALDAAIEKEPVWQESGHLRALAKQWTTCACGNQCAIIPRTRQGMPKDEALARLGTDFWCHVCNCNWKAAKSTLEHIEARAAVVIEDELCRRNVEARYGL